jgi:hypothetical protein
MEPAFLVPLDAQKTLITPEGGGCAEDSTGEVQIEFPPGSVAEPIEVRITPIDRSESLPGPLPPNVPPIFFAADVNLTSPALNKAVTVSFRNKYRLPAGFNIAGFMGQLGE